MRGSPHSPQRQSIRMPSVVPDHAMSALLTWKSPEKEMNISSLGIAL